MHHLVINWTNWMALFQHFGGNLAAYFVKNNFLRHASHPSWLGVHYVIYTRVVPRLVRNAVRRER